MRVVLSAAILAITACAGSGGVPRPDAAMAATTGADLATLTRGRQVYVSSCTGCHALHRTDSLDPAGWEVAVRSMAPKAKLDAAARDDLLAYLQAASR